MRQVTILFFFFSCLSIAHSQFWSSNDLIKANHSIDGEMQLMPESYASFSLDIESLRRHLKDVPHKDNPNKFDLAVDLDLPLPDGSLKTFKVYEAPVMMPGLAAKYPNIKSYKGYTTDGSGMNVRFDINPEGFHATFHTFQGAYRIDPIEESTTNYVVSWNKNMILPAEHTQNLACGFDALAENHVHESPYAPTDDIEAEGIQLRGPSEPVVMRVYRFALACAGEWGQGQSSVESALGKMNTWLNALNQIYENELAISLILVENNDLLIHMDANNDPYSDRSGFVVLGENTGAINGIIGASNYDLGHIWTTCAPGDGIGGVANRRAPCSNTIKANGVTCIGTNTNPLNTIGTAAHEIGHQFDAGHSWSNCQDLNPNDNFDVLDQLASDSAFEPGSGRTIMSYNGPGCGNQSLQSLGLSDVNNFHSGTLHQIRFYSHENIGDSCPDHVETSNNTPEIKVPFGEGVTIPISTPFELTGEATDPENDPMTYSWEQYDLGPLSPLGSPVGDSPSFTVYAPSTEASTRIFPRIQDIIFNSPRPSEVLPTYSRSFTFRFVVRDNNPEAGGVAWEEISFEATDKAGPFRVLYPSTSVETFEAGRLVEVKWDVADTDLPPVNCQFVDISLSVDGGFTYPHSLIKRVPNTGSANVYLPNKLTQEARIKIKSSDNIFFHISRLNSRIIEPSEPIHYSEPSETSFDLCLPANASIDFTTEGIAGYDDNVNFEILDGLPSGAVATFTNQSVTAGNSTSLDFDLQNVTQTGEYNVRVLSVGNQDSIIRTIRFTLTSSDFSDLAAIGPVQNAVAVEGVPTFSWQDVEDATLYQFQLATNPSFDQESTLISESLEETSYVSPILLDKNTVYYWRVKAINSCREGDYVAVQAFSTESLSCSRFSPNDLPINITQSGTPTIESNIFVPIEGQVVDVNVKTLDGAHQRISDLVFSLISPDQTIVTLVNRECGNGSNFDCGFDDEAPTDVTCPLTSGRTFRPEGSLSDFNGENIVGTWKLRVSDRQAGSSGRLENVQLEVCSNSSFNNPELVKNNALGVPPGAGNYLDGENLLAEDADNTADELIYTIVALPRNGSLSVNGEIISAGYQLSQVDMSNSRLLYRHDGSDTTADQFSFTVIDGEGGWIGVTEFELVIDPSFTSSTEDIDNSNLISVFPNPAKDFVNISIDTKLGSTYNLEIFDINGKLVLDQKNIKVSGPYSIETKKMVSGTYFVVIGVNNNTYQKQIAIIR